MPEVREHGRPPNPDPPPARPRRQQPARPIGSLTGLVVKQPRADHALAPRQPDIHFPKGKSVHDFRNRPSPSSACKHGISARFLPCVLRSKGSKSSQKGNALNPCTRVSHHIRAPRALRPSPGMFRPSKQTPHLRQGPQRVPRLVPRQRRRTGPSFSNQPDSLTAPCQACYSDARKADR